MDNLPDHSDFKNSLVAFVDILGFDKRAREISNNKDFFEIGKLLYAIKLTSENLSGEGSLLKDFKFTAISDSIIVSVPFSDPLCTVGMLQILHNIQYELLSTDFKTLLRGYITRGHVYHKNGLIFGAGYSDAYKGEGFIGSAPRIVLDPNIVRDAKRVIEAHKTEADVVTALDYLKEDISDSFYFIDYLKPIGGASVLPKKQLHSERESIKIFIKESLIKYEKVCTIKAKYKWLENYFNNAEVYFK